MSSLATRAFLVLTTLALLLSFAPIASASSFPNPNTVPVAQDDQTTVNEDGSVTIAVLGNDTDPDSSLTIVEVDGQAVVAGDTVMVTNGEVTVDPAGTLTFAPDTDYNGPINFTYTVSDFVATGDAGISYHLESTNSNGRLLFAMDLDTATKTYLGPLAFSTTAMAYDDDSGYLYFIRPNGDVYGLDVTMPISSAAVVGNVETGGWATPVPAAYAQQTAAFYDGSLYFVPTARPNPALDDVLYRIDFANPTTISDVVMVAEMSGDTVEWNNNDDITIDPATGIVYGRSDTNDQANSQRSSYFYSYDIAADDWQLIAQEVYPYDYAVPANNPGVRDDFRDATIGMIVGLDGEVYGSSGRGPVGTLDPANGDWDLVGTFVPDDADLSVGGDFAGAFRYINPSTATVTGTVVAVNDPPIATDDSTSTASGTAVAIDPIAGPGADTDVDGAIDPTSVQLVPPPGGTVDASGAVTVPDVGSWTIDSATGLVTFTPVSGFSGTAAIGYTVADMTGLQSSIAVISVQVPDVGDPVAVEDAVSTAFETPVTIDWATNDTLTDGAVLSSVDGSSFEGGTVTIDADGNFLYTPAPGFSGTDTFDYEICDDDLPDPTCVSATVTVTVDGPPPTTTVPPTTTTVAPNPTTTTTTVVATTTTISPTTTTPVANQNAPLAFTGPSGASSSALVGLSMMLVGFALLGMAKRR